MDINSLTSGDVTLIIWIVLIVAVSVWAMLVGSALIFRRRAEYARMFFETSPWRSFFVGLFVGGLGWTISLILMGAPNPAVKLAAWFGIVFLLSISVVGAAGLAALAGGRIASMESGMSFSSLARGAGLLVAAGLVPFFGWFAYVPLLILTSFGAGVQAITYRPAEAASAPAHPSGEAVS